MPLEARFHPLISHLLDGTEPELIDHELKHRAVDAVVGEPVRYRVERVVDVWRRRPAAGVAEEEAEVARDRVRSRQK